MKRYRVKLSWHVKGLSCPVESDMEVTAPNAVAALNDAIWIRLKQEDDLTHAVDRLDLGVKIEICVG